jgi:hypothetical protein
MSCVPPATTVSSSEEPALTVSVPPEIVPLSEVPPLMISIPPLATVTLLAVPPDKTTSVFPLVTVKPPLVMPPLMMVVVMSKPSFGQFSGLTDIEYYRSSIGKMRIICNME